MSKTSDCSPSFQDARQAWIYVLRLIGSQDSGKLTKAQRKNQKRAEKKAAERSTEKMSVASSELISEADLSNIEFDSVGIPAIEEETIFTIIQDECVQVTFLSH